MRTIQSIIIYILFISTISAQSIVDELLWAKSFKNHGLSGLLIETDNNDNILVAGVYYGCLQCYIEWEGDTIVTLGNYHNDIFVAKISCDGTLLWSLLIGEEGDEVISGFRVDNDNDIILYIQNNIEFTFSTTVFESGHNLLKFNESGQLLWNSNIKGAIHNSLNNQFISLNKQLSICHNNDIIIGGSIRKYYNFDIIIDTVIWGTDTIFEYLQVFDTLEIGNQVVTTDTHNIFIAKFETNGNLKWVKTIQNNGYLQLSSLDITKQNEINILGFFQNEDWEIGGNILQIDTSGFLYKRNVFILKIDESGELIWAKKYFDDVYPLNITTDKSGNIIASGSFVPRTYFEQDTIVVNGISHDLIMFVVDSTGKYLWATNVGDKYTNQNCYLLTNSENEIFLSGDLGLYPTLHKYSTSGDMLWELNPGGTINRNGGDLVFDNAGNLIQTGIYSGNFIIGNDTLLQTDGRWHQYIFKFGNQTEQISTESCGQSTSDMTFEYETLKPKVFPNPTSEKLYFNFELEQSGDVDMFLFSLEGHLLTSKKWKNTNHTMEVFNVENIPAGPYLLKIVSKEGTWSELIIKL